MIRQSLWANPSWQHQQRIRQDSRPEEPDAAFTKLQRPGIITAETDKIKLTAVGGSIEESRQDLGPRGFSLGRDILA